MLVFRYNNNFFRGLYSQNSEIALARDALLQEDGAYLLQEDGALLLLENGQSPPPPENLIVQQDNVSRILQQDGSYILQN